MAIAATLGVIFALACVAGFVVMGIGIYRINDSYGDTPPVSAKVMKWVGLPVGIVFLLVTFFIPGSFRTVEAGEIAVVKYLGKVDDVRTAGTYFDFWIVKSYDVYDAKVQTLDIKDYAYSKDAQTMDLTMTVQYQIDTGKIKQIATTYGSLEALSAKISSVSIERTKSVLSSYSAMEIIETRAAISPEVEQTIKGAISESYYVMINTAVLTNIDFSDAFEQTVEQKMIAEQEQLKAQYEAEKAKIEAEAKAEVARIQAEGELTVAKLAAQARMEAAKGDAQAQIAIAEAEARAIKLKSIEVARMLGFKITERDIVDEDGTTIKEYEIDFTDKSEVEIAVISEYLKYLEYLAKWNGELPGVVAGDSLSIFIPSAPGATEEQP